MKQFAGMMTSSMHSKTGYTRSGGGFGSNRAHTQTSRMAPTETSWHIGSIRYLIDVEITHPTGLHHRERNGSSQVSLAAAEAEAVIKTRKHRAGATLQMATFVPFVVETFGGFGKDAQNFINTIASYARNHSRQWSHTEVVQSLRSDVHAALFDGNIRVMNQVAQRSHLPPRAFGRAMRPPVTGNRQSARRPTTRRFTQPQPLPPPRPSPPPQPQQP